MTDLYIKGKFEKGVMCGDDEILNFIYSDCSNNQCEWLTLVDTMKYISGHQEKEPFEIKTDSLLLYRQLLGKTGNKKERRYKIKDKGLKSIYLLWNQYKNILWDVDIFYSYVSGCDNLARDEVMKQ